MAVGRPKKAERNVSRSFYIARASDRHLDEMVEAEGGHSRSALVDRAIDDLYLKFLERRNRRDSLLRGEVPEDAPSVFDK